MLFGRSNRWSGHDAGSWPALLLLIVVVLVPTVGVLWFMSQAMRNEQLAVRQKLEDVYEAQLLGVRQAFQRDWDARMAQLGPGRSTLEDPDEEGARLFAARVRADVADSVIVYDRAGRLAYPRPVQALAPDNRATSARWRQAERLERAGDTDAAAARYAAVAETATAPDIAARALLAQARCLARSGKIEPALSVLDQSLGRRAYRDAMDARGRLIVPSAQLRALQLTDDVTSARFQRMVGALVLRLRDYEGPVMPASQRRFLMTQVVELAGTGGALSITGLPLFDTLAAEILAARYLETVDTAAPTTSLQPSGVPDLWHMASPRGMVVGLFETARVKRTLAALVKRQMLPDATSIALLAPGEVSAEPVLISVPAGGFFQDWHLALWPNESTLFVVAGRERVRAYLVIGVVVVALIVILAVLVARLVDRQLRLTRLKNDLLATVSHELKTPLASMRLLVDTLLDGGMDDARRAREYLELIAHENVRLSRLVDNFLTFSRLQQSTQPFALVRVETTAVVEAAVAAVQERLQSSGSRFEVEIEPHLPDVLADFDSLVTVLVNLLDNAYKYSDDPRQIVLRVDRDGKRVRFAVRDNGVGLSGREVGRVFDRFYQADQQLSRTSDGCGLGLSIVRHIVRGHGGTIDVKSKPGEGSTFAVIMPAASGDWLDRKEAA